MWDSDADGVCPTCGRTGTTTKRAGDARTAPSRELAVLACLLSAPAWLLMLPFLALSLGNRAGTGYRLGGVALLIVAIGVLIVLVRRIRDIGLVPLLVSSIVYAVIAR